ncbi:AAA family ATPase [Gallaecimonas kandeliae]|uniref:ExeA family protein n=1 Tax=Gallaecimonas kandeliae TaxID=3029055 RepID=UPI00264A153C|nr:AAA family ATPase [Gallaecimonas kandeliae]WKE64761.1 AAA family ATPase [Gallaecimonas kandeliae]
MYESFFGLTENPFSIAPNPHFLYMSERHREALAHLKFGLRETGGFVLLTGEVGTGKTTVSRRLLKELPDNTDLAFVLNPMLTESELLATLCDELEIAYPDNPSLKQLTDVIQAFLLKNHEAGRQTVLLVDEAQHLKVSVLEQLRLLTNLETDTQKLLKIILLGQPELNQLLRRQELRQLSQRITARYHLLPLSRKDCAQYVLHRLRIAGRERPLFTGAAVRRLHNYSGGIPRLINLLCDRAMLGAYGAQQEKVDAKLMDAAAKEVLHHDSRQQRPRQWLPWALLALVAGGAIAAYPLLQQGASPKPLPASSQVPTTPVAAKVTLASRDRISLAAFDALFKAWGMPAADGDPCQAAERLGFRCLSQQLPWRELVALGRPAVLEFLDDGGERFFATLVGAGDSFRLALSGGETQVPSHWLDQHYRGNAILLWRPPQQFSQALVPGSQGPLVTWLDNALAQALGDQAQDTNRYDDKLQDRVRAFQRRFGLKADGLAGENTLVRLNRALGAPGPVL